jgi:hypothetical protein
VIKGLNDEAMKMMKNNVDERGERTLQPVADERSDMVIPFQV